MPRTGLLIVNTGEGKGKTTAALGLAFRALGHGLRVCMIQFIKGPWNYGEQKAAQRFGDLLEIHTLGGGFTWDSANLAEDTRLAREAWDFAKQTIAEARHDLLILDELTYLIEYRMIAEGEVLEALRSRSPGMHVVITGRNVSQGLLHAADLVTEMQSVKHPFDFGVKAQRGIEY
ncbi:MAG: cob(I)yrinic acid a,c-diamide adenosyltransferase [Armatimonadetes bacterium]|nr:cob(I)yrinic acid a,c-diamide adenosyltransferase [Armatimonadota bacterium]